MMDHWSEDSAPYNLVYEKGRGVRIGDVDLGGDARLWWISDGDASAAVEEHTARHRPVPGDVVQVIGQTAAELRELAVVLGETSKAEVEDRLDELADLLDAMIGRRTV